VTKCHLICLLLDYQVNFDLGDDGDLLKRRTMRHTIDPLF
jgi:hypothetical protein